VPCVMKSSEDPFIVEIDSPHHFVEGPRGRSDGQSGPGANGSLQTTVIVAARSRSGSPRVLSDSKTKGRDE